MAEDILEIDLDSGDLTYARFRFIIDVDGKEQKVPVEIAPPNASDLTKKKHAEIISEFLKGQVVKLV